MGARKYGQLISLRYRGHFIHRQIPRIVFYGDTSKNRANYPSAVGFVNYQGSIFPVYRDEKKELYLEQTDAPIRGGPLSSRISD